MAIVKQKAYAKINLTLEVVGQADGYHMLDSFVASIDLFDWITIKTRKDDECRVKMRGMGSEEIPTERNHAWKAAKAFCERYSVNGVDITIDKNIPMGAGLGGSSADVAGVLNGLAKLYKIDDEKGLDEIADALGSDSGYMRRGGFARMQGRGDKRYYLGKGNTLHLLLICPQTGVSTKDCFAEFDKRQIFQNAGATTRAINAYATGDLAGLGKAMSNDLYESAALLNEEVKGAYEAAASFAPLGVTMTGSGSAIVALFETEELCEYAKSRYRGDGSCLVVKTV